MNVFNDGDSISERTTPQPAGHLPTSDRRSRHGRPPSKWLRSLSADEIRIWLKTVRVPEAGVSGMTYWEHLTRDHMFHAERSKASSRPSKRCCTERHISDTNTAQARGARLLQ